MATAVSIGTLYCHEESSLEIRFEDAIFLGSGKDIDEIKKLSSTGVVEKEIKLMCVQGCCCLSSLLHVSCYIQVGKSKISKSRRKQLCA